MLVNDFERREAVMLAGKLKLLAEDVGLTADEIETLIGIRCGSWPIATGMRDLWCPSKSQERRLRMLVEVCVSVISLMGPGSRLWLRRRNAGLGSSPASFLLGEPDALPALRDALRRELAGC